MILQVMNIISRVQAVIKHYKTRDPMELADCLGLTIIPCPFSNKTIGVIKCILGRYFIYVNDRLTYEAFRMVLAHEIGHYILHKNLIKSGHVDDQLFDLRSITEREANIAAAHLLIKDSDVSDLLPQGYTFTQLASMLDVSSELMCLKLDEMKKNGYTMNEIDTDYIRHDFLIRSVDSSPVMLTQYNSHVLRSYVPFQLHFAITISGYYRKILFL